MKKIILITTGVMFFNHHVNSQISVGIFSGFNISKLLSEYDYITYSMPYKKTGYCFGVNISKELLNFLNFDAELLYDHKVSYAEMSSGGMAFHYYQKGLYYFNSYNLSIYPSINIPKTNIFIDVGIYTGYVNTIIDGTEEFTSVDQRYPGYSERPVRKSIFDGTDFGYTIGLMYKKAISNKLKAFARADYRKNLKYYSNDHLSYDSWLFRLGLSMKISKDK